MTARRLAATLSAVAAVAALTGCERPAPIVTVVSGTHSEWKEADAYCFDAGQSLEQGRCPVRDDEPVRIPVDGPGVVGIDVSKDVVERGWFVELVGPNGQPERSQVFVDRHYFPLNLSQGLPPDGLLLTVRSVGGGADPEAATGEWTFQLVPGQ
jgi:hypothetical protein